MRLVTVCNVALSVVALAGSARAEQMVLFDINYTHTAANDSHYQVGGTTLKQPANWTSPIDYSNGTIHFYQEVETKPSALVTIIDFCFMSSGYGCVETLPYTTTGVNETMRPMAPGGHWYQRNQINWTRRLNSIQMILKDPATYTNGCPRKADCLPSKMRFVATIVSPGGVYERPTPTPGFNPGDAGAPPVATPDAGTTPAADAGTSTPAADASVAPPVTADAAPAGPKPTPPKPDASTTKPPTMTDPPEDPEPTPTARKAASGCAVGGTGAGGLSGLLLILLLAARRRRSR